MMARHQSASRLLETHFDEPFNAPAAVNGGHVRSSSHSNLTSYNSQETPPGMLNHSVSACEAPYISSSVTLPAKEEAGFYQNVSGRFRQQPPMPTNYRQDQRSSFSRQAELHKSPRTQELEEFAAKFEGYQKQRSRRNLQPPTPMLDQLARENQFWLSGNPPENLSPLETNLLKLVQRTDSVSRRGPVSEDSSSGRESVTTVISNCSSETLKYTDRLNDRHSSSETLRYSEPGEPEFEAGVDCPAVNQEPIPPYCDLPSQMYGNYINMGEQQQLPADRFSHYPPQQPRWDGRKSLARSLSESTARTMDLNDNYPRGGGGVGPASDFRAADLEPHGDGGWEQGEARQGLLQGHGLYPESSRSLSSPSQMPRQQHQQLHQHQLQQQINVSTLKNL